MVIRVFGFFSFLALIVLTSSASAQDSAAAEALFRSAREAAEQGDWVTACDRFEESKRLEPAPGTVLNLARCREQLGQVASAWKSYAEAAQRLPRRDERHAFARKKAIELEERVPHLTLDAPETDEKIIVTVDGTELSRATYGVPLPFDPGKLEVVVQAEGRESMVTELELVEGEARTIQLELGPELGGQGEGSSSGTGPVDAGAGKKEGSGAGPFFVVGAVGAAVAVGGGIWAAVELPKVKDESNCIDGQCTEAGANAAARGRTAVYLMGAGALVAAGGFGIGAYLLGKKKESKVAVVPLVGGGALLFRTEL